MRRRVKNALTRPERAYLDVGLISGFIVGFAVALILGWMT